jgi:hypothetical protein
VVERCFNRLKQRRQKGGSRKPEVNAIRPAVEVKRSDGHLRHPERKPVIRPAGVRLVCDPVPTGAHAR